MMKKSISLYVTIALCLFFTAVTSNVYAQGGGISPNSRDFGMEPEIGGGLGVFSDTDISAGSFGMDTGIELYAQMDPVISRSQFMDLLQAASGGNVSDSESLNLMLQNISSTAAQDLYLEIVLRAEQGELFQLFQRQGYPLSLVSGQQAIANLRDFPRGRFQGASDYLEFDGVLSNEGKILMRNHLSGSPIQSGDYELLISIYRHRVGGTTLAREVLTITVSDDPQNEMLNPRDEYIAETGLFAAADGENGNSGNSGGNSGNSGENPGNSGDNPGNSGENPGNSGENPGNSGDNPGNSGDNPGNSGENPGNSGDNPGNSDENPGNSGDNPGNSDDNPGNSGENPGNSGENPGNSDENPGNSGENPGNSGDNPGNSGDNPGNSGDNPGNSGENPGNSGDNPGNSGDNPGNSGENPGNSGDNPGNSGDNPGNSGENPGNSGENPGNSGENPGNSGDNPGNSGENPGNSGENPGNSGENPGNSGENPGNSGDNPGNSGENPGNSGDNPGNSGENPGNSGENPGNSGENPGNSGDNPGNSGENPGNSGENPGNSGENPGNSGENPGNSGENPGNSGENPGNSGENPGNSGENPDDSNDNTPGNFENSVDITETGTDGFPIALSEPGVDAGSRPLNISNPYPDFRWEAPQDASYRLVVVENRSQQNAETLIQSALGTPSVISGASASLLDFEKADLIVVGTTLQYPATGVQPLQTGRQYYWQVFSYNSGTGETGRNSSEIWSFRLTGGELEEEDQLTEGGSTNVVTIENAELRQVLMSLLGPDVVRDMEIENLQLLDIELENEHFEGDRAMQELQKLIEKIQNGTVQITVN